MNTIFGIIVGILVLTLLVVVHEFGHFLMAIKNGVEVKEFAVGFPPRALAWHKKNGKWRLLPKSAWSKLSTDPVVEKSNSKSPANNPGLILSLNWLPIGGFCSMKGESAASSEPHSFGQASFKAKTKILFGGVLFNFIFAVLLLTILAWTGLPQFIPDQYLPKNDTIFRPAKIIVAEVKADSPASQAGILPGDQLFSIDDHPIFDPQNIIDYNEKKAGQPIKLKLKRSSNDHTDPEIIEKTITLNSAKAPYRLGVTMSQTGQATTRHTWSAPLVGLVTATQFAGETFRGIGRLFYNLTVGTLSQINSNPHVRQEGREKIDTVSKSVSGPIGIIGVLFPNFVSSGLTNLILLTAIISLSLACMNVLPIPALDGGRWLLIAIYKLRHRPLTQATEEKIVGRSFFAILGIALLITIIDVIRIIQH